MDEFYNYTLLTDFYELTMANGFFEKGFTEKTAYFDLFFRKIPDGGGFAIMAGLEQFIHYIKNLHFSEEDILYLKNTNTFSEKFIEYLRNFKFTCDIWAIPEGTPVFPGEPLVTIRGPIIEAQLIETMALVLINHQSLIATKANRIKRAAQGRKVIEFGARRAQGISAALYGARAAFIGGVDATSCTLASKMFSMPYSGTMAHSFVQTFENEYEAFKAYAEIYPENTILLVDTYNTIKSGIPNAIKIFNEIVLPLGFRPKGIRIDSGDITYLSKKARKMLDEAGFSDCNIIASNSLDEDIISDILLQGAKVDSFGVGERLITASSDPVFGGVYKLVAIEDNEHNIVPRIKLSENVSKITLPCFKQTFRMFDNETGNALADVITLHDEEIEKTKPYELFDPNIIWKRKTINNFTAKRLTVKIFERGECVYKSPSTKEIREFCKAQVNTLWEEVLRLQNPHRYYVDLSQRLWDERQKLLKETAVF